MNKHVQDTVDQIENTLMTLDRVGLASDTHKVNAQVIAENEILTWPNHVSGRDNAGASFNTLNQYFHIFKTGAYHCVLFDGSIIRAYFKFHDNRLLEESLLYWPAPVRISIEDANKLGIYDAVADIIGKTIIATMRLANTLKCVALLDMILILQIIQRGIQRHISICSIMSVVLELGLQYVLILLLSLSFRIFIQASRPPI